MVTVVCFIFKIRRPPRSQQTSQPTNLTNISCNNTFQTELVGEPLDQQRTSLTNIDSVSEYPYIDDMNANVRDYANVVDMSSRPLPPIPLKRAVTIYCNNTFQAEPIDESLEEQRTSRTNKDMEPGYTNVDDINANVRNFEDDFEMSSDPLPLILSKSLQRKGPLIIAQETPVNINPEETIPETLKVHYMGLQRNEKNKHGVIV